MVPGSSTDIIYRDKINLICLCRSLSPWVTILEWGLEKFALMVMRRIAAKGILHLWQVEKSLGMEQNLHRALQKVLTDLASWSNSSMLHVISTPRLYIYIIFLFDRARGVGAGRKGGSKFFPIEEPCKSFWKLRYITRMKSLILLFSVIFLKFCMEYCYHLTTLENSLTEA